MKAKTANEKNQERALRVQAVDLSIRLPDAFDYGMSQLGGGRPKRSLAQVIADAEIILKFLRG